jgi:hypothetical protein
MSISRKPWNTTIRPGDLVLYRKSIPCTVVKGHYITSNDKELGPIIWSILIDGKTMNVKHWEISP